ncbi:MAG TPA: hemolysin family protein [Acidobacteriota bacterium]|nr:hemolysin family protein [Acidobacteriota bacterium]
MTLFYIELAAIVICLGFLFFFALIESAISQSSPLALRMINERPEESASPLLSVILENSAQVLVPLHFSIQLSFITVVVFVTHLSLGAWPVDGVVYSFATCLVLSILFRQLLPRLFTQNNPEKKLVALLRLFQPVYRVMRTVAAPLSHVLKLHKQLHEKAGSGVGEAEEEATEDEIQAYLGIGEDEGIIEEEDSRLIQSVVEFGNTLVREVMTPRTRIIACEENATVDELREIMVRHRHSRIPIYRENIDHVIGVVYMRRLLAHYAEGGAPGGISSLINPVMFVPGTKPVAKLLKELQGCGDHIAIVIDEYGGVSGLITIEDLVEEIVGEIRDEDEAKINKIVEEGKNSYVVHGSTELNGLEDLIGRRFETSNCSTVAGLVISFLGRLPVAGEAFDMDQLKIQILDADRKRVHWMRVQAPERSGSSSADGAGDTDDNH